MNGIIRFEFTPFVDWKKQLLARYGLEAPDRRALYLYRLTEEEFANLEKLVSHWLSRLLPSYDLVYVARLPGFADLFVLYAAEWWRRRYDGSGFSWDPILHDLGANPEDWSANQRSENVERGFRGWGIRLRDSGGLRFIGSVAIQGGLPLKLLASSRGRIGQLLGRVLHLASGAQVTQIALQNWVESLANTLPRSYRQETIYALLAEVAWTVLDLKEKAELTDSMNALNLLDQKIPSWRDRFPLPIEDEYAQGMIEQLIRDSANVRVEKQIAVLPLERVLEKLDDDVWELCSRLVIPDVIPFDRLMSLFSISEEDLPRRAELTLCVGITELAIGMRRLAGHQKFRLERKPLGFSDDIATGEHLLRMASPDGRIWTTTANRGDQLDDELPWVFIGRDSSLLLALQGSGGVAAQQALVALPEGWKLENGGSSEITDKGMLRNPKRQIHLVSGVVHAFNDDGLKFRLRTGRADSYEESYVWEGNRYWLDFISPSLAFKGMPVLHRTDQNGFKKRVEGQLGFSHAGSGSVSHPGSGPLYLRYPASGHVLYRSKVLVLPSSANLEFSPHDAVSGTILFTDWGFSQVRIANDGFEKNIEVTDGCAILDVAAKENSNVPEFIELEAYWLHPKVPVRFRLPFPSLGVRVLDSEGNSLTDRSALAVQQLQGVRMLVFSDQSNCRVDMRIFGVAGRYALEYSLRTLPESYRLEIRLQDYLSDIQKLLSASDLPDTQLSIQVRIQGQLMYTLFLSRYSALLERETNSIRLDTEGLRLQRIEDLDQTSVLAMRLESPGDDALCLEPVRSEGVATGSWLFSPNLRSPGSWLIFPGAESKVEFRPTLWSIEGELKDDGALSEAFSIVDQIEREQCIDDVIEILASNFDNENWEKTEQLASQVGHLPLPTLDIWRRFAKSKKGMAAMALRFSTSLKLEFISRFSEELPFTWETIAFADWLSAMRQLEAQCIEYFGEQDGNTILQIHLAERVQSLTSRNGSLAYLLGIAASGMLPDTKRDVAALKSVGLHASEILFKGEGSKLMALRRLHADDDWPTDLRSTWRSIIELDLDIRPYIYDGDEGFRTWIINVPILCAVHAVTGRADEWCNDADLIHALRKFQDFDLDWFEEAYNMTIAHCFADGLFGEGPFS
ncbi:MAG: STY4851/ECs_5259 family protein [Aestuariivita sp.]|nr:STY4851/ECs_5259 family protein [Aestuariivita sp.]